jgi:16S rRNA pseudouridine516 synthase
LTIRHQTLEYILQHQGIGSRKACRQLIEAGAVSLEGEVVLDPKHKVEPEQMQLCIDDEPWVYREHVCIVLNKPKGYECSRQPQHYSSVFTLLPAHFIRRAVQPVGRLDQDTTGLLILTDQGKWAHTLMSPKHHVEKEYRVHTKHAITPTQIANLQAGVQLNDQSDVSVPIQCVQFEEHILHLTIAEGQYHQVKRMIAAAGNRVVELHRLRIGQFVLPTNLEIGQWQDLTPEERNQIGG